MIRVKVSHNVWFDHPKANYNAEMQVTSIFTAQWIVNRKCPRFLKSYTASDLWMLHKHKVKVQNITKKASCVTLTEN